MILQEMTTKGYPKKAADYITNVDVAIIKLRREALERISRNRLIAKRKRTLTEFRNYWILDPIDGTTNLIRDYHLSAVSLGLYENGEITFGVVYNPFTEELFYGAKGEGAYLNGTPIHVSDQPGIPRCCSVFRLLSL